ncbi:MAG: protein kinase, partial [Myxococcota bacterium]|nr:protein kinase [Myxococcota bacterium]
MDGKDFGSYRLVRLLARGGMAEVYLAINEDNPAIPRRVALKKILPIYGDLREFTQLFKDEARIGRSLDHSNIVRVLDHGIVGKEHFLVMEHIDGPDLEKLLTASHRRNRPLSIDLVCYVAGRIAASLDYAHHLID